MPLSTCESIKSAVKTGIESLNLAGLGSANIAIGKVARYKGDILPIDSKGMPQLPGILIANYGNKAAQPWTNARDEIPYQILVAGLQSSNGSQTLDADRIEHWLEQIGSKFRHQPLSAVPTVASCDVTTDINFDPTLFASGMDGSMIVLRFLSQESRG